MATDYDAPRKSAEDENESLEALKERPEAGASTMNDVDADNLGFEMTGGDDISDVELDVVVLPQQDDEFTCTNCFLVRHRSQFDHDGQFGPVCAECSA
ncbi:DUF4193 family protein [Canibacter zhoujuaniae]|uniref:DUF4193 family protein n=1 Tax=Canibacter zhoujuaniae TaxID=2708343 RepID=UPI0014235A59|nr:DUF4193 family protein [Canibacter zhoujuaniae]